MEASTSEASAEATPLRASRNPTRETNAARPPPTAVTMSTRIQEYRSAGRDIPVQTNPQHRGRSFHRSRNPGEERMGMSFNVKLITIS